MIERVLIVDDELLVRDMLCETALRQGLQVSGASSGEEALQILKEQSFQLAFFDLKMKKMSGLDLLKQCRRKYPEMEIVMVTAYGTVEVAVEAMRLGAFDFVIKPFTPDQMEFMIKKVSDYLQNSGKQSYLESELLASDSQFSPCPMVANHEKMKNIRALIERVANTDSTVLITGESGTGKEMISSEIRRISDPDAHKPYIRINCAAIPEDLLESELFGHEKGAFTGAIDRRVGRFELADGGILLLDEIGEIKMKLQAKLLRVLQESEFERIGGNKTIHVNTRILATTNRDLRKEVQKGNFREDLFYRLNVFPIHLPPLRERGEDVLALADAFLDAQNRKRGKRLYLSDAARKCIRKYSWPGNVRELENIIERISILHDGPEITVDHIPVEISEYEMLSKIQDTASIGRDVFDLKEIERFTIYCALRKTNGNQSRAAELLGFSRRTLINKLERYREEKDILLGSFLSAV